ncbi:MAG: glycine--tRNA ligase subunit alpha, partial [bacterium]
LGAWGLGWQVELNGIEITQFTYFQQCGGIDLNLIPVELTYGLERIAMFIQNVDSIFEVKWDDKYTWGDIYRQNEQEYSAFNFEEASVELYKDQFDKYEAEANRLLEKNLIYPGYDHVIKCSHIFNLLEARGAMSVSERTNYIARVRKIARQAALKYLEKVNQKEVVQEVVH